MKTHCEVIQEISLRCRVVISFCGFSLQGTDVLTYSSVPLQNNREQCKYNMYFILCNIYMDLLL